MDLSIVIVSFNARADLERCLQSLAIGHGAPARRSHEIIVVDNASADGSADAARRWPDVRVIETGENVGFACGANIGIRASSRNQPAAAQQRHRRSSGRPRSDD